MKHLKQKQHQAIRAYTLIEALVASSVLLIGISAAASMSLALVTQEEINERSVQAVNYLDNAARLYQLGVDTADIPNILPDEPLVKSLTFSNRNVTVPGIGTVNAVTINLTYKSVEATTSNSSSLLDWTGGDSSTERTISIEAIHSSSYLTATLPRVNYFQSTGSP